MTTSDFTIRHATPEDAAEIARIYRPFVENTTISFETEAPSAEEMRRRIKEISSVCPYLVAETGNNIAAYCYAHPWKERAAYAGTLETTVYVDPSYSHNGLGKTLMEKLISECREAGFDSLIACITANNDPSCRMHESLGFKKVSHFSGVGRKLGQLLDVVDYQFIL